MFGPSIWEGTTRHLLKLEVQLLLGKTEEGKVGKKQGKNGEFQVLGRGNGKEPPQSFRMVWNGNGN
jgi:hypothetical protein